MAEPKNTGKFGKGNPGKPKGATNKMTKELREMVLQALDESGGVQYLVKQANARNPAPFMALLGKVLPMQVEGGDNPIKHSVRVIFE